MPRIQQNHIAGKELAYAEQTSNQSTAAGVATLDIPGVTITVPPTTGPVELRAECAALYSDTAAKYTGLRITETTGAGSPINAVNTYFTSDAANSFGAGIVSRRIPGAAISRTFKLTLVSQGGGSVIGNASADFGANPIYLAATAR